MARRCAVGGAVPGVGIGLWQEITGGWRWRWSAPRGCVLCAFSCPPRGKHGHAALAALGDLCAGRPWAPRWG